MLEIFIYSLIISVLFTPFGVFFIGNQHRNLYWFTKELIYGLVVLSFLAILFNFFYPLNIYVNSTILLFFLIIFIKYKEYYLNFKFLKFTIILSFLITLLITESNVYRPDAGLYHLPFIGILNSEKIIPISNTLINEDDLPSMPDLESDDWEFATEDELHSGGFELS